MSEPFVLGANYWPRRKAMSWWSAFDPGEVRDEFALFFPDEYDLAPLDNAIRLYQQFLATESAPL